MAEEYVAPDARREEEWREGMAQPPYVLKSPAQREVVRDAIVDVCRRRGWRLLGLHVRTNHVHAVVVAADDPGRVMSDLKAGASRQLTRAGFDSAERRRWTRHGSTLHLFDQATVPDKIDYTLNRQGAMLSYYDGRDQ